MKKPIELTAFISSIEKYAKSNQKEELELLLSATADLEAIVAEKFEMDALKKKELLAYLQLLQEYFQKETDEKLLAFIIGYILISIFDYLKILGYSFKKINITLENPDQSFWFNRIDAGDSFLPTDGYLYHQYNNGGNYLTLQIPTTDTYETGGTIPYFNAEIYNSPYTSIQPMNVVINTFPVDLTNTPSGCLNSLYDTFLNLPFLASDTVTFSSRIKAENLKGGSRGWGFWNTTKLPTNMNTAWFIQIEGKDNNNSYPGNGFFAQTQNGLNVSMVKLPDLDADWHDYTIKMTGNSVEYFIDNISVYKETDCQKIPNLPMAFNNWVDNAVYAIAPEIVYTPQSTTQPRANHIMSMQIQIGEVTNSL